MSACVKFITCGFWSDLAKYVFNSCTFDSECSECCKIHFVTTEIPVEGDDDESTEMETSNCFLFRHNTPSKSRLVVLLRLRYSKP